MQRYWVRAAMLAVAVLATALVPSVQAFDPAGQTRPLDRAALVDRVVAQIHARYWDPRQLEALQWLDKANAARADVLAAPSTEAAVARINALLAETKASHIGVFGPDEHSWYVLLDLISTARGVPDLVAQRFWGNRPYYAGIGSFTVAIEGKHFVDAVMDGSPAAVAGIKVGDEIVDVAGAPYHQIRAFLPHLDRQVEIGVRRQVDGPVERVKVQVTAIVPGLAFEQATVASTRVIAHGGLRIGYFRLWAQFADAPILKAMARLTPGGQLALSDRQNERASTRSFPGGGAALTAEPLDALIIDLRGKVGGRDHSDLVLELLAGQRRGVPYVFRGRPEQRREARVPRNPSFIGRTAVLIDHHTRSAGELLANSLKAARVGPLIGTTTVGHVLAAGIEVLPGDYVLQIPVSRPEADGLVLEGRGVAPDIRVEAPVPYSNGADPVLAAALRELSERLTTGRAAP